jgi:hypothetical protein
MAKYDEIIKKIIKEQELLMGPVAWYEAGKVPGLHVIDPKTASFSVDENTNGLVVVDSLVGQYGKLFGQAAREVCREAVTALVADLAPSEVPSSLR